MIEAPDEFWGYTDRDYRAEHHDLVEQIRLVLPDATEHQVILLVGLVLATCPGCHNAGPGCYCQRDD